MAVATFSVGDRIRELRRAAGLSQGRLALVSSLDSLSISQIERGVRTPTLATLIQIVRGLGVPLADMHPPTQGFPSWPEGCERPESEGQVGQRLRTMRRALGMTQADLSRASGLSQKTISRIEAAKNANITWEVLIALAEAFGVNLNAFTEVLPPEAPTSKAS